jgi:hypothetical protein
MYPQPNLDLLSRRKLALLETIRERRSDCAGQLEKVLQPVLWAEGMYARWKAISPAVKLAAVPVGVMVKQKLFPAGGVVGGLLRYAPMALKLFRSWR